MKSLFAVTAFAFVALTASAADGFRARVTEVYSGDTMAVRELGGRTSLVTLANIGVPRRYDPFAAKSRESLRSLVKHKRVTILPQGRGSRDRYIAVVLIDDLDVGIEQIRRGLAWYAPEGEDAVGEYMAAEDEAASARRGIWSQEP